MKGGNKKVKNEVSPHTSSKENTKGGNKKVRNEMDKNSYKVSE